MNLYDSTFNENNAIFAGAIYNRDAMNITGCTFCNNSATTGGVLYIFNGTSTIHCCRFTNNTATQGKVLYNDSGTTYATENWWGTNSQNIIENDLIYNIEGTVDYEPWISINLLPEPLWPILCGSTLLTADFVYGNTNNSACSMFEGTTVIFNSTSGLVTPTSSIVVNNTATTTITGITNKDPFNIYLTIDANSPTQVTLCQTATPAGVYVSSEYGNDGNLGTYTEPVRTIQRGINIAQADPCAPTVYLEAGSTFTGVNNINLTITTTIELNIYNNGAKPIIDMQGNGRFCSVDAGITATISNLQIIHGHANNSGGAFENNGTLNLNSCLLSSNQADDYGGAIINNNTLICNNCAFGANSSTSGAGAIQNNGILQTTGCTFSNNSTIENGGAIYNDGTAIIHCCRFIANIGTCTAIYNTGTINATNNWWGTNYPDRATLFNNTLTENAYTPYIVFSFSPRPFWPQSGCNYPISVDFTKNSSGQTHSCTVMNNSPIIFSSDIEVSPTLAYITNGYATTTLLDVPVTNPFEVCATTGTDLTFTGYTYCQTATPHTITTIYVSSSEGNDSNLGNSEANPVKTIGQGLANLSCRTTTTVHLYLKTGDTFTGTNNKDLTITNSNLCLTHYGTGAAPIIDMQNSGRFCTIAADTTMTMSNVVIINGYVQESSSGGAIYNNGTLTIIACIFNNNIATSNGGALYSEKLLNAYYCSFTDNNALCGGAIEIIGSAHIDNCIFNANYTQTKGGAIHVYSTGNTLCVNTCIFNENSSEKGGAIGNYGSLYASGCTFNNNRSTDQAGGAIYNNRYANGIINCCRFINNNANNSYTIYNYRGTIDATNNWWGTNHPDTIESNLFYNEGTLTYDPWIIVQLLPDPLAVNITSPTPVIADFTYNNSGQHCECANFFSGSVKFNTSYGAFRPEDSWMIDGQATSTLSGIITADPFPICIYTDTDLSATYELCETASPFSDVCCVFISDKHGDDNNEGTEIAPIKTIAHGLAIVTHCNTGTIYLENGSTFTGINNKDLTITVSSLLLTTYNGSYGSTPPIINMENDGRFCTIVADSIITMSNLEIRNGKLTGTHFPSDCGGAILNYGMLTIFSCTFSGNAVDLLAGGILNYYGTLHTIDSVFSNNTAHNCGAIFNTNILNTSNCIFSNNSADNMGGALGNNGTLNANSCTFNNNSAYNAGALFNNNALNSLGCTFINNNAYNGGAIYALASTNTISCCRFADNIATTSGNAIYNNDSSINAARNWWGTNTPNAATLFAGAVNYSPWITFSLSINPSLLKPGLSAICTLTSSPDCIPDGVPVLFSTTDGTITPTSTVTINGQCSSIITASLDGLPFDISSVVAPQDEHFTLNLTVTPYTKTAGLSFVKLINGSYVSTDWPGIIVPEGTTLDISYLVTNTGLSTLSQINVIDDQGYIISQPYTNLEPNQSMTCTATTTAPGLAILHKNIGTVTGKALDDSIVSANATAYATSIPVGQYRFNWDCKCTDTGTQRTLIGSYNNTDLTNNSIACWTFDTNPTITCIQGTPLELGDRIIINSAVNNDEHGINIAILTHEQTGTTSIILATVINNNMVLMSQTTLPAMAFKVQWLLSPFNNQPYLVTDEQDNIRLYSVDLNLYTLTPIASAPNKANGLPSTFLYWLNQGTALYIIQGYNETDIATYKVALDSPAIEGGIVSHMHETFSDINACSTYYRFLVLGGTSTLGKSFLARYLINNFGHLIRPILSTSIADATTINYCERCCCSDDNHLLVGTDNGLYSLNPNDFTISASITSMPNNNWVNVCWCCCAQPQYCTATNSDHKTYVFQEAGTNLNKLYNL